MNKLNNFGKLMLTLATRITKTKLDTPYRYCLIKRV